MAKSTITAKIQKYFPSLSKTATWGDAWDECMGKGYTVSVYDSIEKTERILKITIYKTTGGVDTQITQLQYTNNNRTDFYTDKVDIDDEKIYKACVEFLTNNKHIKKPRGVNKILSDKKSQLDDLLKQRSNLSMRLHYAKKKGKDTTELLAQRDELNARIDQLR